MAGLALGLPLEQHPELMEKPDVGAQSSLWYWNTRVKNKVQDFANVKQTTKNINPGMKGLKDRIKQFAKFGQKTEKNNK
jgi:putative chitinase